MPLKRLLMASAFALTVAPAWAAAQMPPHMPKPGSNPNPHATSPTPNNGPARNTPPWGGRPGVVAKTPSTSKSKSKYSFTGEIVQLDLIDGFLAIEDSKGRTRRFYVKGETMFKADKGTALTDKQTLSLEDFQKGQTVKVSLGSKDFALVEVRLLSPKD